MAKKYYSYEQSHRTVKGVKQKRCSKCKKWKGESEFHRNHSLRGRLCWQCKNCENAYARMRYKKSGKGLKTYRRYEECHRVVDGMKQKQCNRCKKWKAESEFYKRCQHKDGLAIWCKACSDKASSKSRKKRRLAV
jgi:hypothetical protein